MSHIGDLVERLCPNGVEFRALGELGEVFRGRRFVKSDYVDEGIGAIHYGQLYTHFDTRAFDVITRVREDLRANLRFVKPGDVVIAEVGETVEDVGRAVAWLGDEEVAIHDGCYGLRHDMDPVFIAYYLQTPAFHSEKNRHVARAKMKRLSLDGLRQIRIPIPPQEVQQAIVRTLERFESLEAELSAELQREMASRRQQYEHYRDALLTFAHGGRERVRWVTLGEVGSLFGGLTGKSKLDFQVGGARFVSYRNVFANIATDVLPDDAFVRLGEGESQRQLRRGDVLFTGSSETIDQCGMSSVVTTEPPEPLYLNSFCIGYRLHDPALLDPEFSKHLFRSAPMRRQIVRTANGVTRFNVSKARLAQIAVPIPPRSEQERLAAVLDRLDVLVSELSVELPAELAARRAQYQHYRGKLLVFTEAA